MLSGQLTNSGSAAISSLSLFSPQGKPLFNEDIAVFPVDITIYNGMSGAPALSPDGSVIGLISGSWDNGRGIGWIIPSKYISASLVQSPQSRLLKDVKSWPPLSLMKPEWRSLKRSYGQRYSVDHIAKLEILESVLSQLQGTWKGTKSESTSGVGANFAPCNRSGSMSFTLRFGDIDQDHALLRLRADWTIDVKAGCDSAAMVARVAADVFAGVPDDTSEFVPNHPALSSTTYVTDCVGDVCSPRAFGQQSEGSTLEIISASTIRWSDCILRRQ